MGACVPWASERTQACGRVVKAGPDTHRDRQPPASRPCWNASNPRIRDTYDASDTTDRLTREHRTVLSEQGTALPTFAPLPRSLCEGGLAYPGGCISIHDSPEDFLGMTPLPPYREDPPSPPRTWTPHPMSQHHARIKNDPRWKAARAEVLERDGHACVECGETEGLQVDHIIELALIIDTEPDLAFDPANLRTLCQPHHAAKEHAETLVRHPWVHPDYSDLLQDLVDGAVLKTAG